MYQPHMQVDGSGANKVRARQSAVGLTIEGAMALKSSAKQTNRIYLGIGQMVLIRIRKEIGSYLERSRPHAETGNSGCM